MLEPQRERFEQVQNSRLGRGLGTGARLGLGRSEGRGFLRRARGEEIDQASWPPHDATLIHRQRPGRAAPPPLLLEEEDRQGSEEREVLSRAGMFDPAAILVLSAIAPVMLTVFNGPMPPNGLEALHRRGLMLPETADGVAGVLRGLPDLAFSNVLALGVDAQQPDRPGQADVGGIDVAMPHPVSGDAPVLFLSPLV